MAPSPLNNLANTEDLQLRGSLVFGFAPSYHSADPLAQCVHLTMAGILRITHLLWVCPKYAAFRCTTERIVKQYVRIVSPNKSFINLAVREVHNFLPDYSAVGIQSVNYPCVDVLRMLVECGDDVNSRDTLGNTALHFCVMLALTGQTNHQPQLEQCIRYLLDNGAHADQVNNDGFTATHGLEAIWPGFQQVHHQSLKCLAAKVIKRHNIPYKGFGQIPADLVPFVDKH